MKQILVLLTVLLSFSAYAQEGSQAQGFRHFKAVQSSLTTFDPGVVTSTHTIVFGKTVDFGYFFGDPKIGKTYEILSVYSHYGKLTERQKRIALANLQKWIDEQQRQLNTSK